MKCYFCGHKVIPTVEFCYEFGKDKDVICERCLKRFIWSNLNHYFKHGQSSLTQFLNATSNDLFEVERDRLTCPICYKHTRMAWAVVTRTPFGSKVDFCLCQECYGKLEKAGAIEGVEGGGK